MVKFYRKFGNGYKKILHSICKSELLNFGLKFSIDDFRTNRVKIRTYLKEKLKQKLENEYLVDFFELYFDKIKFTSEINRLNLLRMLNGIYNERAVYDKQSNLTRAETELQVQIFKNKANEILEKAKTEANNLVIKKQETDSIVRLEFVHLNGLNTSVYGLDLFKSYKPIQSSNETQKVLSFCYLNSLINNDKIRILTPDKHFPLQSSTSSQLDGLIGLINF